MTAGVGLSGPRFFGRPGARLYGCLHQAADPSPRRAVIAQPVLHEYMGSHRTLVQLATRLALANINALRFDFHGVGDSAGESGDGTLDRWQQDVASASAELSSGEGARASIVGLRLGATVALLQQTRSDAPEVPSLVLWDPIVDGRAYLDELQALHRERFGAATDGEVLGFPLSSGLRDELARLEVSRFGRPRARRVLVLRTSGTREGDLEALAAQLREAGAAVDLHRIDTPPMWRDAGKTYVPRPALDDIVSWLKEA
jgi:alpha-beta hydrolase superfamily lysophospholipase